MTRARAVAVFVVLCACSKDPDVSPPTDLRVEELSFDDLHIGWTPPSSSVDGFELEGRIESGPFQRVHDGLIPGDVIGGTLSLEPETPEMVHLAFRIRSVRGGARSAWSAEAAHLRTIRPPTSLTATLVPGAAISLAWTNVSLVANEIAVERAEAGEFGQPIGDWSTLPVWFGAEAFTDGAPTELVHNAYRVRYGKDGIWSAGAVASAGPVPVRPPAGLTASMTDEGVALSWTNRSEVADELEVRRWPDGTDGIATLADDAVAHVDTRTPVWPSSRWAVVASAGTGQESAPAWVGVPPFEVTGPVGPLRASAAPVPDRYPLLRSGDGGFAYVDSEASGTQVVVRDMAAGVERHALSFRQLVPPSLALDGAGRPHALGYDLPATGPITLVHEWLGDGGWTSEMLPEPPELGSSTHWGVDASGAIQLLAGEEVCAPSSGAWACAPVPDPPGWSGWMSWRLYVSRDGTTLLGGTYPSWPNTVMAVATRTPGGTFSTENVPLDCGYNSDPRLVPDSGGDLGLVCHKNNVENPPGVLDVHYAERRGGVWSSLEALGATATISVFGGAATPGLERVHVWTSQGGVPGTAIELWSRGPDGWTGQTLAPSSGGQGHLGYLDTGKVWFTAKPSDYSYGVSPTPFSLWEEP